MNIEKLERIKEDFIDKYNVIRTKEFLVEISEGYGAMGQFMIETITALKKQSNMIADLRKKLAQKRSKDI